MREHIDIAETVQTADGAGFVTSADNIVASVRAYREERSGTILWANRAAFSDATCLFRFRVIPGVTVTTHHIIICGGERYRITSAEDVRGRGMYVEILAELIRPSKG